MLMTQEEKKKFAVECNRRRDEGLLLRSPKTYGVKEELKEAGAIWDGTAKGWLFPNFDTLNRFELELGLPVSYDPAPGRTATEPLRELRAPTNRETIEAILDAPTVEAAAEAAESYSADVEATIALARAKFRAHEAEEDAADRAMAKALEEAEMVIEARETELADLRFRMEAMATALSCTTPDNAVAVCRKVTAALLKVAYADKGETR